MCLPRAASSSSCVCAGLHCNFALTPRHGSCAPFMKGLHSHCAWSFKHQAAVLLPLEQQCRALACKQATVTLLHVCAQVAQLRQENARLRAEAAALRRRCAHPGRLLKLPHCQLHVTLLSCGCSLPCSTETALRQKDCRPPASGQTAARCMLCALLVLGSEADASTAHCLGMSGAHPNLPCKSRMALSLARPVAFLGMAELRCAGNAQHHGIRERRRRG